MKTMLQRYIAASFIAPFLVSCLFFVSFLLSFKLFSLTNLVVNKGLSIGLTVVLLAHISVTFLPMAFPISSLFASLFCMGKFSKDSEYIAMRSFGLGKREIITPFILVSFFIALMILALNIKIIPASQVAFNKSVRSIESSKFLAEIKSGQFFTEIPDVTIFSEKVMNKGSQMENIFIHLESENEDKVIFSQMGNMIKKRDFEKSSESLRLILEKGNISKIGKEQGKLEKIIYNKYDFPVTMGSFKALFQTKASMMSSPELWKIMNYSKEEKKEKGIDEKYYYKICFEFWNRINTPLICMIFVFIGISFGVQDNRGKRKNVGALSLGFLVAYYAFFFLMVTLSQKGTVPTWFAVFFPTLVIFFYSLKKFKKLDWISN